MYLHTDINYHPDQLFLSDGNIEIRYGDLSRLHSQLKDDLDLMSRHKLTCGINTDNRLQALLWMVFCWIQNVPFVPYHSSHTEPLRSFHPGIVTDQLTDINDLISGFDFTRAVNTVSLDESNDIEPLNALFNPFLYPAESIFCGLLTSGSSGEPRKVPIRRGQMITAAGNSIRSGQITLPVQFKRPYKSDKKYRPDKPIQSFRQNTSIPPDNTRTADKLNQLINPDSSSSKRTEVKFPSVRNTLWGNCLPLYHAGGMTIIFRALLSGTGVFLWAKFEADLVRRDLTDNPDIRRISLVPTMMKRLLDDTGVLRAPFGDIKTKLSAQQATHHKKSQQEFSRFDNLPLQQSSHSLENVLVGGGPAPGGLIQRARKLGWPVIYSYGMTETCGQITAQNINGTSPDDSVGCPFPDHIVTVKDDNGQNLKAGKTGTIWIKGPQVFSGYLSKTEDLYGNRHGVAELNPYNRDSSISENSSDNIRATNQNLDTDTNISFLDNSNYFNTGDFGHFDSHGNLYVESRRTDLVVSGGVNIRPAEIEDVLHRCPFVSDTGVTGITDEKWGQRLVAFVVPSEETKNLSGPEIKSSISAYLSNRLKPHQLPKNICLVEAIPRTGIGKIKRKELLEMAINLPAER